LVNSGLSKQLPAPIPCFRANADVHAHGHESLTTLSFGKAGSDSLIQQSKQLENDSLQLRFTPLTCGLFQAVGDCTDVLQAFAPRESYGYVFQWLFYFSVTGSRPENVSELLLCPCNLLSSVGIFNPGPICH
jgi:hypothetical protein